MRARRLLVLAAFPLLLGAGLLLRHALHAPQRPDIIIISIDTLRADHAGFVAGSVRDLEGRSLTPHLDDLARSASGAREALSPVPLTLPAHASLFSGLFPDRTGIRENDSFQVPPPEDRGYSLLAEDLRAAGYETRAYVSGQPLDRVFGLDAGFTVYDQPPRDAVPADAMAFRERNAERTTDQVVSGLASAGRGPLFLFVHYFDPHHPYLPPEPGDPLDPGRRGSYAAEVRRVDRAIGRLVRALEARGRPRLLLVTSDHGEGLGEHGEETHGFLLHESTLRVPFLLLLPEGRTVPAGGPMPRLVDVHPTVLEVAGAGPSPPRRRDGRSLLQPPGTWMSAAETLYPYYQFRAARLRAVYDRERKLIEGGGEELLFEWTGPSGSERPVQASGEDADRLRALLFAHLARAGLGRARDRQVLSDAANPYLGGRSLAAPTEPSEEENARLPHPARLWDVVHALEDARAAIRAGDPGRAEALLWPLLEAHPANPALLFWAARSADLVARDARLGPESRLIQIDSKARPLYERHAREFRDPRSRDALLRLGILRHQLTGLRADLEAVVAAATLEVDAGERRPLLFVFRAQAREGLGDREGARADFLEAARLDPEDSRIRADLDRLSR
jgi:choline-sulfatase